MKPTLQKWLRVLLGVLRTAIGLHDACSKKKQSASTGEKINGNLDSNNYK